MDGAKFQFLTKQHKTGEVLWSKQFECYIDV